MGVLGGEGGDAAFEQTVHLLRVRGGVDAAQYDLAGAHHGALSGGELFDLGDHITAGIELRRILHDPCTGLGVCIVGEAGQPAAVVLGPDLVSGGADAAHLHGRADHPVLALFYVSQNTKKS